MNFLFGIGLVSLLPIFLTAYFGTADTLPYGLDAIMVQFMEHINILRNVFPPLDTIWEVFVYGLIFRMALFFAEKVLWVITLIRG